MAPRIAIYARAATVDQQGASAPERQVERLRAYAEERGWPVAPEHVYRDEGVSGLRRERPGLDRLLTAVVGGDVDVVLVGSRERLARDELVLKEIVDACERADCRVVFADHG